MNYYSRKTLILLQLLIWIFCFAHSAFSQSPQPFVVNGLMDSRYFIENRGQFNQVVPGDDSIWYGIQRGKDQIFFCPDKISWILSRQYSTIGDEISEEEVGPDREGEGFRWEKEHVALEWLNVNPHCGMYAEERSSHYFVYGIQADICYGYRKLIVTDLYPNIDLEYIIPERGGVKYSLILYPGADVRQIRYRYTGDSLQIVQGADYLTVQTRLDRLMESGLRVFDKDGQPLAAAYAVSNETIGFQLLQDGPQVKTLTIDPWITSLSAFEEPGYIGVNGYDVDYDLLGNVYVYGRNSGANPPRVAKYSPGGNLLWIFGGKVDSLLWPVTTFYSDGAFAVDKSVGKVFLGEAFNSLAGARVIRLNTAGHYDHFVSSSSLDLSEIWDMNIDCQTNQLIVMGGGTRGSHNLGLLDVAGNLNTRNITGYPDAFQDILSSTLTPNGELFVAMASGSTPALDNKLIKVNAILNGNVWIAPTGYNSFFESDNKKYPGTPRSSNGFNALASNQDYLFCYDGVHLSAYDLNTGAGVGVPYSFVGQLLKEQGGIYVDECNYVYVGTNNGSIRVFKFDGTDFTFVSNILLPGATGKHIYDLKYSPGSGLLCISGQDFVAAWPLSEPCSLMAYDVIQASLHYDCTSSVRVTVNNPDSNALYNYVWTDSTSGMQVKSTRDVAVFSDSLQHLQIGHVYHVFVSKSGDCSSVGVLLRVTVLPTADTVQYYATLCKGKSFSFRGKEYTEAGQYLDTMVFSNGCYQWVKLNIELEKSSAQPFFIPSAFSPNGDARNDCFGLKQWINIQDFELLIVDRWGKAVFRTKNQQDCWNGTYRGKEVEAGVYFYLIKAKNSCGDLLFKGDLHLVR